MSNVVFRTKPTEIVPEETNLEIKQEKNEAHTTHDLGIEVPYTDYEIEKGKPLLVDYYQLGDTWNEPGGFYKEIESIKQFIQYKIDNGEIANSQNAVKDLLKGMEKTNNLTKEERPVVKLGVLSAYVEFLLKQENIKLNLRKYGQ
jgi:hypothetical protein